MMLYHLFSFVLALLVFVKCQHNTEATVANDSAIITFVIERGEWNRSLPYGATGDGHSMGLLQTKRTLTAFLSVASIFEPSRRPVLLRPGAISAPQQGKIPITLKWEQLYDWDVDSDEFASADDVWRARRTDPERFEVFDVFEDSETIIRKIQGTTAEVVVLHMYVLVHGSGAVSCPCM